MKNSEPCPWLRLACRATVVAFALSAPMAGAQEPFSKSEIVTITDADAEFFSTVDQIRSAFQSIAAVTPAFREAEEIAKRLALDPLNDQLKKEMIAARSKVLYEKKKGLREVVENETRLDAVYDTLKRHLDALITESQSAIQREETSEVGEADFLAEALSELKQLDQLLSKTETKLISTDVEQAIQLTTEQRETIRKFKQQLHSAELEMKLAQQSVDLHQRQLALLGLARVKATEDYLDLKMAISSAGADQAIFGAIARNDLVGLKVIGLQDRLNTIMSRAPVKYRSQTNNSVLGEGFQFSPLPSPSSLADDQATNHQEAIDRVEKALDERKLNSAKAALSVSNQPNATQAERRK